MRKFSKAVTVMKVSVKSAGKGLSKSKTTNPDNFTSSPKSISNDALNDLDKPVHLSVEEEETLVYPRYKFNRRQCPSCNYLPSPYMLLKIMRLCAAS